MRSSMFEYMSIFVQVVEQGGFAKAADVLHLHRPAVTKAIQHLEDDLGTKLLNRTTRKVTLTEEGDAFYQRTKVLLEYCLVTWMTSWPLSHRHGLHVESSGSMLHCRWLTRL